MSAEAITPSPAVPPPTAALFLTQLYPSPTNPRTTFNKAKLAELEGSIRKRGVLQPIIVRLNTPPPKKWPGAQYEIVAGESRWRAAQAVGLEHIPAIVREISDGEVLEIQLEENMRRAELHALDEAGVYQRLMSASIGYSQQRVMDTFGLTEVYLKDRLRLLSLVKDGQDLFRSERILLGHAVALARLSAKDQERAIDPKPASDSPWGAPRIRGGLWQHERSLFDDEKAEKGDRFAGLKPVSVKELEVWIAENIRFDAAAAAADQPELFPDVAAVVTRAKEQLEKVVSITYDHQVPPELKTNEKVLCVTSWKRADGRGKTAPLCDFSVTGVVVVGRSRGQAFKVCINKEGCKIHWAQWQRERKERAKAPASGASSKPDPRAAAREAKRLEKERIEKERQEQERERYDEHRSKVMAAVAEAVKKAPTGGKGKLADLLVDRMADFIWKDAHRKEAQALVPRGSSAEDLVRHLGFILIVENESEGGREEFAELAKDFGVDVNKVLDSIAPLPASTPEPKKASTKKPAAKKGKGK